MIEFIEPVPFTLEVDEHLGLSEVQGLLSATDNGLLIEYRVADTVVGVLKSKMKTLEIPLADISSLRCESRLFGLITRIHLTVRRQQALADLPGVKLGDATLTVRWKDRRHAESFCLDVRQVVLRVNGERIDNRLLERQRDEI